MAEYFMYVLLGGPKNGEAIRLERDAEGAPPAWLHCFDPMPSNRPMPSWEATDYVGPVAIYERLWVRDGRKGGGRWQYHYWTPPDTPNGPEMAENLQTRPA